MTRAKRGFGRAPLRSARIALLGTIAVASLVLSGCNGSDDAATAASAAGTSGSTTAVGTSGAEGTNAVAANTGPTLQGTAITTATVGTAYSFQPKASEAGNAALAFSVTNKPAWTQFNSATGQLSGTPSGADVGKFAGDQISASE